MNDIRNGNFTSSEIWKLCTQDKSKTSFGKPALTYIREKNFERNLGRSLDTDNSTRPMLWGVLVETRVHKILPFDYILASLETISHPSIEYWKGSPDMTTKDAVCDIKCPQLKSFCELVEVMRSDDPAENLKKEFPEYFWQLVSNSILTGKKFAELIVYVPYRDELTEIKYSAENYDGDDQAKYLFIYHAFDDDLPYLIEGRSYKNLNILRWEVSQEDKDFLTARVQEAGKFLINQPARA